MATSTLGSGTLVLAGTTSGTTTVTATAVAGTTTLTLPAATDTLVGKATTDTLTNKTLGAVTLGGTVAGGGNQINNVIIGTTTPLAGAFTTLSSTQALTVSGGSLLGAAAAISLASSLGTSRLTTDTNSRISSLNTYYDDTTIELVAGVTSGYQSGILASARSSASAYADSVSVFVRSAEAMRITSTSLYTASGIYVGIGTSAASGYLSGTAKLVVLGNANSQHTALIRNDNAGSSASAALALTASGNTWGIECGSSAKNSNALTFQLDYGVTNSTKMTLDASGNLLVGTTSVISNGKISVKGASQYDGKIVIDNSSSTGGAIIELRQNNSVSGIFAVRGSVLGSTAKDLALSAGVGLGVYTYTNDGTAGPYVASGGTSWTSSSDERLKNITGEIQNGLEKVCSLRAAEFTWKSDLSAQSQVGLIAQDVQSVLPQAVNKSVQNKDDQTEYLGVAYTDTIPLLVAAIKELKAEFDAYKASHP